MESIVNNTNEEFDILAFDASQLSVNNPTEPKNSGNSNIYRTRPADSKSEDGVYRAQIKVIYNPFDFKNSVLEQQAYALQDADGWFSVVSSLTNNDTNCPIFKAWKTCHYSKDINLKKQEMKKEEGGRQLFDKRFARYVTIQVLDDPNQPDLNGKYMFWKMPKAVWDVISAKQSPKNPQKSPVPVMDFLFGRAIDIEVYPGPGKPGDDRYTRETKYMAELSEDPVACVNPDKSSLLNAEQQKILDTYVEAMKAIWKEKDPEVRAQLKAQVDADPNTAQLKALYRDVIEKIKSFCPNMMDVLGYKPWDEATTARVQNWINIVLAGNDPTASAQITNNSAQSPVQPDTMPVDIPAGKPESEDDDLPF